MENNDKALTITKNKMPEWHKQQELILKRWSEIGASYRFLHVKSFMKFEKQNMGFAIPVIVISTITGTANFAQGSFPESMKEYVPLVIGFFNLAAGLITTLAQFLRVSELLEGHRSASIAYSKFSRNISVELSLPIKERTCGGTEFINTCRAELDRLIEQSPNIPDDIIQIFVKQFPSKDEDGNPINQFFKPEIFEIKCVEIYEDQDDEEEKLQMALQKKQNFEQSMRNKILKEEQSRRKKLMKEFEKQKNKKEIEFQKLKEKEKMTTSYISKSLDGLLSGLGGGINKMESTIDKAKDGMTGGIKNSINKMGNRFSDVFADSGTDSEAETSSDSNNESGNDNVVINVNAIDPNIINNGINNGINDMEDNLDNMIMDGVNSVLNTTINDLSNNDLSDNV